MLTAFSVLPHSVLRDVVDSYTLCKAQSDVDMTFPLYATNETCLSFFIGNTSVEIEGPDGHTIEKTGKLFLFGLSTRYKGIMRSTGNFHTFTIEFKPNGFYKIFGIPAFEICNNTFTADEVVGNDVGSFYEQLVNASSVQEIGLFTDAFLLGFFNRQRRSYLHEGITEISSLLLSRRITSIPQCAYIANMSLRNFERRFNQQIGTSPKLYSRLVRFNAALMHKLSHPGKNWTDISYEIGYYDSMHMIKDFKQFSHTSPTSLLNANPGFLNGNCYKVFPT